MLFVMVRHILAILLGGMVFKLLRDVIFYACIWFLMTIMQ